MPKAQGPHKQRRLTAVAVRSLARPGRYGDGDGLQLLVDAAGSRRWVLRLTACGRRRDVGLGSARHVSLSEARDKAAELRRLARNGVDPVAERRKARTAVPTFEEAARRVHSERLPTWRSSKHAAQWLSPLKAFVFPSIGRRPVDQIERPDIIKALAPIWLTKPETARRVRQRLHLVFKWSRASGHRDAGNPVNDVEEGLPRQPKKAPEHFKALPFDQIGAFVRDLRRASDSGEITRLAVEYLALTATRLNEVRGARWEEIDLVAKTWFVPSTRTKTAKAHRVPLSDRCIEILECAKALGFGSDLLFPGRSGRKPLSPTAIQTAVERVSGGAAVPHGFRSSFRDWCAERGVQREVAEQALGHVVQSPVERAYKRTDLFDRRRELMELWAAYVAGAGAEIISLQTRR